MDDDEPRSPVDDTTAEARRIQTDVYRRMSYQDKWRILCGLRRTARQLAAAGYRLRNPHATDAEVHENWLRLSLGDELLAEVRGARPDAYFENSGPGASFFLDNLFRHGTMPSD